MTQRDVRGRVLCLTSNFPRWAGDSTTPFVLHLNQDLQALGWEVDVLAPHAPGAARREVLEGLQVERFRYAFPEAAQTVCYQGGAMVNLRQRPWEKLKLPALVGAEWGAAWGRVLRRSYDLVHCHWVLPQGFVGLCATRYPRLPYVVTIHGGDVFSLRGRVLSRFKAAALAGASAVTVNSSFTERAARELLVGRGAGTSVARIPMGINSAALSAAEAAEAARLRAAHRGVGGPLLVFVGRLVFEKGAEVALDALLDLRRTHPGARLLVVGDGPEREPLQARARAHGLQDAALFLGWLSPAAVRAHLAAADVFVGPSRTAPDGWVEAQGLTFLEAMAVGTPVVASELGGIPDAVHHEGTGLLVPEGHPEALAAAIRRFCDEPALRQACVDAGARLVAERFSRQASAAAFSRCFERALGR